MLAEVPPRLLVQFRTCRYAALPTDVLNLIYHDKRYLPDIEFREKIRNLPRILPIPLALSSHIPQKRPRSPPPTAPTAPTAPSAPSAPAAQNLWTCRFCPVVLDDLVFQNRSVQSCRSWLATASRSHALLLVGPTGCGKTTLARLLLPTACILDFDSFSMESLNAALHRTRGFVGGSVGKLSRASAGIVVNDFSCLPLVAQTHLLNLLQHFGKTGFPLPMVIIMDEPTPSFARASKPYVVRVSVSRLSARALSALGYSLCRKAGMNPPGASISQCAAICHNARQFTTMLQGRICGSVAFCGSPQLSDFSESPFDVVRRVWSSTCIEKTFQEYPAIEHWLAANTPGLLGSNARALEKLADFCDYFSQADEQKACTWPQEVPFSGHGAVLAARCAIAELGLNEAAIRGAEVCFPESLRCHPRESRHEEPADLASAFNIYRFSVY